MKVRHIAIVGLTVVASSVGMAEPAMAATAPSNLVIGVVTAGDESTMYGIAAHAANDASFRTSARQLTAIWAAKLQHSNKTLPGLSGGTSAAQLTAVTQLQADLASGNLPRTEITSKTGKLSDSNAGATAPGTAIPFFSGHDPNSFSVRGNAGSGNLYWQNMNEILAYQPVQPKRLSA